ncbi:Ubiquinone biosynthesis O-methyltransferase, mitochondrial [Candidatus Entotheonellaceae bacterium PAL068K]
MSDGGDTTGWQAACLTGDAYDAKFRALESAGQDVHGEANLIASLGVSSVLDAGCGTGRVAIELARRGYQVAGVDRDAEMLQAAHHKAPHLTWYQEDLAELNLLNREAPDRLGRFEAIVMAGNVMIFLDPGTEAVVIANLSRHLAPGGLLIAGFQLIPGGLTLEQYDAYAADAALALAERWSTWDRNPWSSKSDYAVSVHGCLVTSGERLT